MRVYVAIAEEDHGWDGSVRHVIGVYTSKENVLERFKISPKYGKIGWEFDWEEFEVDDLTN